MRPFRLNAGVYLMLQKGRKILLLRRCNKRWAFGKYILIAGYVDGNESIFDAVVRETREEVSIKVLKKDLRLKHIMHRKSDDGTEYIDFFIKCNKWKGNPINAEPHEHDEIRWSPLTRLPTTTVPNVINALKHISKGEFFSEYGFNS